MIEPSPNVPKVAYNPFTAPMVTGHGVKGRVSGSITYEDLVIEATRLTEVGNRMDWPCVAKTQARWFLPSTLASRHNADQVDRGVYVMLVVDVDDGSLAFSAVEEATLTATDGAVALIYSTKSATVAAPRWRVVVPLERPLPGADYADTAKALYTRIREASGGRVDPDDAVARPSQISFLPNAPDGDPGGEDHLAFAAEIGNDRDCALDLTDNHPIVCLREAQRRETQREANAASEQAKKKRKVRTTLIDRFNARHSLDELLRRYQYVQATDTSGRWPTDDWRSPYQTSGSYATRVYIGDDGEETWVSLSGSDAKRGLGSQSAGGSSRFGDAFDLYRHFEHDGQTDLALKAWKAQCDRQRNVEVRQRLGRRWEEVAMKSDRLRALSRRPPR